MEETNNAQLEILTKIHNQLADLTKLIAEVELSKTTSEPLKAQLQQLVDSAQHVNAAGHSGAVASRGQKVIAPENANIQPGEGGEK